MLSGFWKSGSQGQGERDAEMRQRVAITSIYAAKLVDPTPLGDPYAEAVREQRIQDTPMTAVVHADVNKVGHALGSHAAARYYLQENKKHRDEVLAQAAAEE